MLWHWLLKDSLEDNTDMLIMLLMLFFIKLQDQVNFQQYLPTALLPAWRGRRCHRHDTARRGLAPRRTEDQRVLLVQPGPSPRREVPWSSHSALPSDLQRRERT